MFELLNVSSVLYHTIQGNQVSLCFEIVSDHYVNVLIWNDGFKVFDKNIANQELVDLITKGVVPCKTYSIQENQPTKPTILTAEQAKQRYFDNITDEEQKDFDLIMEKIQSDCDTKLCIDIKEPSLRVREKLQSLGYVIDFDIYGNYYILL